MSDHFKQNRLSEATSPYLLQHKDNPVHWQPWEQAAFDEARRRHVPVLLSIGYAACHWCHVMAHESFEDPEVAAVMNAHFVCIKLDREERPDIDDIYMTALALMGEQGGWPLTVCLDHDKQPFWGGTYFPKTPTHGRPGFVQILNEISRVWSEAPDRIAKNTTALASSLKLQAAADARADMPADLPPRAAAALSAHIDHSSGGLAGAPKFPQPFLYRFLWEQAQAGDNTDMQAAIAETLRHIINGGIYDHIGGGLARYAVDAHWLVPHFEKMLYDNALLIDLMTLIWRQTGDPLLPARIGEIIAWLERDMLTDSGAFAASLDADSDGEEGLCYTWTGDEIRQVLGPQAAAFLDDYRCNGRPHFEGRHIPHLAHDNADAQAKHIAARAALLRARSLRPQPARDDKVLADWNGMMVASLAEAATVFERPDWLALAKRAYDAAIADLTDGDGVLRHSARAGRTLSVTLAADHAFMGQAAFALYEATGDLARLTQAVEHADHLHRRFHNANIGGYHAAPADTADVPVHNRPYADNAAPSANAAALRLFAGLALAEGRPVWSERAEDLFAALSGHLEKSYPSMTALLSAHHLHIAGTAITIIGAADNPDTQALAQLARRHRLAARSVTLLDPAHRLPDHHPAAGKTLQDGRPAAYVCPGRVCLPPITHAKQLTATLDGLCVRPQSG